MASVLETLSSLSTTAILAAATVHLAAFGLLWFWYRSHLRGLASALDAFTRDLRHRSVLDVNQHLTDQIQAFLADVDEVLESPHRRSERDELLRRINILDEQRSYLQAMWFETVYNSCRTMIEAYPLAGVMGTVLAIGVVLQGDANGEPTVSALVMRFGESIWATFSGLASAIVLMFLNSLVEPPFLRLAEQRQQIRETISRAKRLLSLPAEEKVSPGS